MSDKEKRHLYIACANWRRKFHYDISHPDE